MYCPTRGLPSTPPDLRCSGRSFSIIVYLAQCLNHAKIAAVLAVAAVDTVTSHNLLGSRRRIMGTCFVHSGRVLSSWYTREPR